MTMPEPNPQENGPTGSPPGQNGGGPFRDRVIAEFVGQAEKLSLQHPSESATGDGVAVEARFVTPQDPVLVMADGNRLPPVPLNEAQRLNVLREELQHHESGTASSTSGEDHGSSTKGPASPMKRAVDVATEIAKERRSKSQDGSLRRAMPPTHTNPLFPPLPLYGPPSLLRNLQCRVFRVSSFFLSLSFLGVIVLGALFTSIGPSLRRLWLRATLRDPDRTRPFYAEEINAKNKRQEREKQWREGIRSSNDDGFTPTEGGPDPIVCDPAYYARRVGLDIETLHVQTEDGFIIDLWHVYDPKEYRPLCARKRADGGPDILESVSQKKDRIHNTTCSGNCEQEKGYGDKQKKPKFPVLLMHGLLQSSGAYCVNDDASLAFYLCKSGYDVWLGNNRCGFSPKHALLDYSDPRMWCWNIRQMGVFDLPALASRVLAETGFERLGLIAHSQGTTQTLVALAKEQRPDFGEKLTVFCALAPAAYAGPLIGKMYFKFMRIISPSMFRLMFGIHAFIPFMMTMHRMLNPRVYGWLGYKVFSFLFNWTDARWDRGLRDRMFQFAPVYVSSESMRWWLGRECFARHKCILATKEEWRAEEREDAHEYEQEQELRGKGAPMASSSSAAVLARVDRDMEEGKGMGRLEKAAEACSKRKPKGSTAWYNHQAPPFALWVCGNDALVDGEKLLRRFKHGREPHVRVVHSKVIPEYEHLDVIWAMDAPEQVFKEVREVLWKTCDVRDMCRVPKGCEDVEPWIPPDKQHPGKQGGEKQVGEEGEEDNLMSSSSEDPAS